MSRITPGTLSASEQSVVDDFHLKYHASGVEGQCFWLGHRMYKTPGDLLSYQEIIFETRPDLLIECGTFYGGSTMFFATVMDLIGHGRVLSIDIEPKATPDHPRIEYLIGSSIDPAILTRVQALVEDARSVMVVLDSLHGCEHVSAEMECYSDFVTVGKYLVVEDTALNGHPIEPEFGCGPMEAVVAFMSRPGQSRKWKVDRSREKYLMTYHPGGFLRRFDSGSS